MEQISADEYRERDGIWRIGTRGAATGGRFCNSSPIG